MDTEVTAEEFSGHDNAAPIDQILPASLEGRPKSPDAVSDAPSLIEQFAGIVYFSEMTANSQDDRRPTHHRNVGRMSGAESARSTRGRRAPTRPWRLPAVDRNPKV
jgi:hypothetical protein